MNVLSNGLPLALRHCRARGYGGAQMAESVALPPPQIALVGRVIVLLQQLLPAAASITTLLWRLAAWLCVGSMHASSQFGVIDTTCWCRPTASCARRRVNSLQLSPGFAFRSAPDRLDQCIH